MKHLVCPLSDLYFLLQCNAFEALIYQTKSNSLILENVKIRGHIYTRALSSSRCCGLWHQFCATIPHTETVYASCAGGFSEYQFMQKNYYQPYTVASCVSDVVNDASDQEPLRFARIDETLSGSSFEKVNDIVSITGLTKGQVVQNVSGDNSSFLVNWVDLPLDIFNTGIPGAVVVNTKDQSGSSYNITTCTFNAGWGSSSLLRSGYALSSRMSSSPFSTFTDIPVEGDKNSVFFYE